MSSSNSSAWFGTGRLQEGKPTPPAPPTNNNAWFGTGRLPSDDEPAPVDPATGNDPL